MVYYYYAIEQSLPNGLWQMVYNSVWREMGRGKCKVFWCHFVLIEDIIYFSLCLKYPDKGFKGTSFPQFTIRLCMVFVIVESLSPVWLSVTPWTVACQDFSGKRTGVGCGFLLQGIFLTQGWNSCLWHWQTGSLPLSHQGSLVSNIVKASYKADKLEHSSVQWDTLEWMR